MTDDGSWGLSAAEAARAKQRPEAYGVRGMVASAHPAAATIGMSVLQRGGNAFDAAIAVAAAEGVVLPMKCGLGGDAFVVLHDAKKRETVAFNGSGVAASGATRDYYASRGHKKMPFTGVHSVSVPGAVSVYEDLHKRYCTMSWADLFAPAIDLAENGVAITAYISARIAEQSKMLSDYPHSAAQFLPKGEAPRIGARWSAPDLAKTLRTVARGGADVFYRGEIAERIVEFLKREGAPFELQDFAQQQAVVYQPISSTYRGITVYETAPPSQGFLLLEQLNILEGYELAKLGPFSAERIHLLVEAKKLAFADRNLYAGDPAFVNWPLDRLISKAHAQRRRTEIDPTRSQWPKGAALPESGTDTSYFCVADGQGNAVSFIHSLSSSFGSGVVAGDTGVTLNNRAGRGFSLDPQSPNVIAPGRRTMHTLNAYMLFQDGKPWLIGGTPGGDQQTQWSTQIITSIVDHGFSLQQAVDAPRWYSFPGTDPVNIERPPVVRLEDGIPEQSLAQLADYGHTVERLKALGGGGAVQLIQIDPKNGVLRGASDPRPGGMALGF